MRGDMHRMRSPREAVGHEQRGERFAVLLQSDALAALSTLIVAPTSTSARPMSFRPEIEFNGKTPRVLVDQLKAVDSSGLGDFAGRLDRVELVEIDEALHLMLGLLTT
ncbi:type II toxin-antitoxin system PemK/MazF family toxin [Sphaerisporangium sp. TRM90804]|uniref:type II toxin-antitoxin system PemK/MazF family toxin n=1 Tax=Sphaerisporangium sp. TRM90804 TaxID=3031113 RepID=UPI00244AE94C|nr:type II toxin-antitoxin system PemK/MazF family toxin [Sphaerisporangium sp. TRM90804]MDH2424358.1 type II toxin-antitoxin system PemK/MazF family toxin [Sphaerisporangium sp. TRM90804]